MSNLEKVVRQHTGKSPDACSDKELLAVMDALRRGPDPRKHDNKLIGELRSYRRRRWQDECKEREVKIRADFLRGYDHGLGLTIQPKGFDSNPNIDAGHDWGSCISSALFDDDSISPEYLATIRAGLCEAHVASTRFGWNGNAAGQTYNPYRWIAGRLEELDEVTE